MGLKLFGAISFWESFWIRADFLLLSIDIYIYVSSNYLFISSLFHGWKWNQYQCTPSWNFPIWHFFESSSEWVEVYFRLESFLSFSFSVKFSSFPYFAPYFFCFCHLVVCVSPYIILYYPHHYYYFLKII